DGRGLSHYGISLGEPSKVFDGLFRTKMEMLIDPELTFQRSSTK
ncbi:2454_t:CDS:1, partial [Cetraspora pellucida]